MKLLVIDGNSIANRAFYGIKILTTKDGKFTNAIYGFMNILNRLLTDEKPDGVAVAFDLKKPTFRHKMYDKYKAHRKGMPEELAQQMPVLKQLLADLGFAVITCEGYEADDVLGTLSQWASQNGDFCSIATGDKDSLQLINNNVKVLLASTRMGKSETIIMDEPAVFEKYGVCPKQLIEVKALMGDASDNIPGVAGVGEKTALALIQNFKNLDGVYQNIDDKSIKPGARQKLENDKETAYLSRQLAEISLSAPVAMDWDIYTRKDGDLVAAQKTFAGLEMFAMAEKFGLGQKAKTVVHDNPNLKTVAVKPLEKAIVGTVLVFADKNDIVVVDRENVYTTTANNSILVQMLADENCTIKAFDAKPLYHIAFKNNIVATQIVFDAKLAAYLLNPSGSEYTIEHLCDEYAIAKEFACEISVAGATEKLFKKLEKDCTETGMQKLLQEIELPLCEVLAEMEHIGIAVDKKGIETFGEALRLSLDTALAEIYTLVGYQFNVNSPKQLGEALFVKLGLPTRKKTKSGFSTDAETLESLKEYHPVINYLLEYRTHQKLYSTYVEGLLKVVEPDGRIRSTFNQTETRTGRISSGEPNLQNIPVRTKLGSQLRKYFVAKDGAVLLDADYSQIELRILADISGDETMQQAFIQNKDIHQSTAAKIYGLPENMVTPQLRSSAKAVNFGIVYGIGAFSLSKDIGVSVKEADNFIKNYLDNFAGVRDYMDKTIAFGKENGYVQTLFGRRRNLPELSSSNFNIRSLGERMAMNTPIQGTAADIIKIAMVKVYQRLRKEGLQAKLILQVHDELILEAPLNEKELAKKILGEEMQNATKLAVPLPADVNCGENWYVAKG